MVSPEPGVKRQMNNSAYSPHTARDVIAGHHKDRPGPYTLIGYGAITDPLKGKRRAKPADAPLHETLFQVHAEFRKLLPSGRYVLIVAAKFDPETWDPKHAILLDTQVVEKAMTAGGAMS